MKIEIIQPDNDKTNYFERIAGFLTGKVKTREQLEQRFDILLTEFAMALSSADYDTETRVLRIKC